MENECCNNDEDDDDNDDDNDDDDDDNDVTRKTIVSLCQSSVFHACLG